MRFPNSGMDDLSGLEEAAATVHAADTTVRTEVRDLLGSIKNYGNPSVVAAKVQEFLESSGTILTMAEENLGKETIICYLGSVFGR